MKTKWMGMGIAMLAGASMFAQPRVSIGVGIGGGYAQGGYAPAYVAQRGMPPCPGPGYSWVDGYWSHDRGHRSWMAGYWQRQPRYEQRYRDDRRDFDRDRNSDRNRSFGNGYQNGNPYQNGNAYQNGNGRQTGAGYQTGNGYRNR